MKHLILSVFLICCCVLLFAQQEEVVEKKIRELEDQTIKAILSGDTNTLKKLWSPEFSVNTPRNDLAENRDAVLAIQKRGLIDYVSFNRVIEKIKIHERMAITMGQETFVPRTGPDAGKEIKRRFLNVWMKEGAEWKHIARQASIICQ